MRSLLQLAFYANSSNPIAMTAVSGDGQLTLPVSSRDRIQGSEATAITLVKYGNYQCSQCAASHKTVKAIQTRLDGQLRFVFRHFPCTSIHPYSQFFGSKLNKNVEPDFSQLTETSGYQIQRLSNY